MGLQGQRDQADTLGVDVQVLIGHEEEMVLPGGAQAAEAREDDRFPNLQDLLHVFQKSRQDPERHLLVDALIVTGIEPGQQGVVSLPRGEIEPTVRRVDRIALVGERGGHQFGHETAQSRKGDRIVVHDRLLDHLCEQIDIHRRFSLRSFVQI